MGKTQIAVRVCLVMLFISLLRINAQQLVTIPWSSSLYVNFGTGTSTYGPPISSGYTQYTYSTKMLPDPGYYSIVYSTNDAGHIYFGPFVMSNQASGYKMRVAYDAATSGRVVYRDTARNLCSSTKYLFWMGINNVNPSSCLQPNLTISVETLSGTLIKSWQTGKVGGPLPEDFYAWYYEYYDPTKAPKVPFYGGIFQPPPGITDVVVKVTSNPTSVFQCGAWMELDNIIMMPVGPDIRISSLKYPGGWIAGTCYAGNSPLELVGKIDPGYIDFGTPNFVADSYTNPAFQWQQSLDDGYTWTDIPGETAINISHNFNNPDTFWVRMRVSEAGDINNKNCSNVSNVIHVQVEPKPTDFSISSNSPVCTDGDLTLSVTGGATYFSYGPNGWSDNSAHPHIYHPVLADSGWYYTEVYSFGGCKAVDSTFVRVIGPNITVSDGKAICYGDTVHLHAAGGIDYSWSPVEGLNNPSIANPIASPVKTTKYEVMLTDQSGCHAYGNVLITLRDSLLKADIFGPNVACPADVLTFRDTSQGAIINWAWDFGNGQTSTLRNPPAQVYPVTNGAFFPVSLTITDTAGCVQTKKVFIKSVNSCYIAVPSAFTPNNDGLNDFLYPLNAYKATDLQFRVYDRWGRTVFETRDWTRKWDGTINGVPQPTGVYVWILQYTDEKKQRIFLKGTAALIR